MQKLFERWQKYLNEYGAAGMGGNLASLQGAGRAPMAAVMPPKASQPELGSDLEASVKAVLHRNGMVLLIKNDKGWDLPGGHIRQGENKTNALVREVFEETGLNIDDIQDIHMKNGNKHFFSATFLTDDITLSDEHSEYGFFDIDQIRELDNLSESYRDAIFSSMGENVEDIEKNKLIITLKK
jgi:8-oxo-dGTP diphosphatase